MTERIEQLRDFFITKKEHHAVRAVTADTYSLAVGFAANKLGDTDRAVKRLTAMLETEKPVIFPLERLVMTRTNPTVFALHTPAELELLQQRYRLHEKGEVCNISADYTKLLDVGFEAKRKELGDRANEFQRLGMPDKAHYLRSQSEILTSIEKLTDKYRSLARRIGRQDIVEMLLRVPRYSPRTFPEALQMFRIIHYAMWLGGNYHNTVGRFDQYMYPYYKADIAAGRLNEDTALEWVEEFFLTFNRDSDLYVGMQQGDNGQSMVLGGLNLDGEDTYNALSHLCLKASLNLSLIDPKINLRVSSKTPLSVYELGSQLTKQGLGFPQYANDDMVIPALQQYGYSEEDAHDYVVAACWEFIIPGKGMDVPNIDAVNLARAAQESIRNHLSEAKDFETLMEHVKDSIKIQALKCMEDARNLYVFPAPYVSLMMSGCVESARDISMGCVYNNYGFHGTGIATAVDSLAAVRKHVFRDESISRKDLLAALEANFDGFSEIQAVLRYDSPKMGNNDTEADDIAIELLDTFADSLEGHRNERGGVYRAGTGSAMYYLWHADGLPATADGRSAGEGFGANFSPSLFARLKGPVSIMQSFSKPNLARVCNGGPLTLELHDTLFRNQESIQKVALMVRSYMMLGGLQLQLNAINRGTLVAAQRSPDEYRNLIVRVWGWSGYFVELDKEYQDHIMSRTEYILQ